MHSLCSFSGPLRAKRLLGLKFMSYVVWIFCIPFFLRACLTDNLYRKGGSLRRRLFVIKLWKPGRIFEFLSVAIFSFWGQVMDMFYDCYKSDAGKLFVVSGD